MEPGGPSCLSFGLALGVGGGGGWVPLVQASGGGHVYPLTH